MATAAVPVQRYSQRLDGLTLRRLRLRGGHSTVTGAQWMVVKGKSDIACG